jgi:hypothetical protein
MPYILRDSNGKITRVSARPIHTAEVVRSDDPEVVAFLKENGQDPEVIEKCFTELRRTDADMSRAIEDVIMALMRKNILKMSELPRPVQDKMALRVRMRVDIQEAYDKASGTHSATLASSVSSTDF